MMRSFRRSPELLREHPASDPGLSVALRTLDHLSPLGKTDHGGKSQRLRTFQRSGQVTTFGFHLQHRGGAMTVTEYPPHSPAQGAAR